MKAYLVGYLNSFDGADIDNSTVYTDYQTAVTAFKALVADIIIFDAIYDAHSPIYGDNYCGTNLKESLSDNGIETVYLESENQDFKEIPATAEDFAEDGCIYFNCGNDCSVVLKEINII